MENDQKSSTIQNDQKQQNEPSQHISKSKFETLRSQIDPILKQKWEDQQNLVKTQIIQKNDFEWDLNSLDLVAGVDLSASKNNPNYACAALIVYSIKKSKAVYEDCRIIQIPQPYVPGFLAFREIPPLYAMFNQLKNDNPQFYPQLILLDGNGILHCNQCGIASHLGVLLDTPTIGAGKTLFFIDGLTKDKVKHQCEQQILKEGDFSLLKGESGKIWGAAVRTTQNSKNPVFVSIRTKIGLQLAIQIVTRLSIYRVVEPIRLADKRSRQIIEKIDWKSLQEQKVERFEMVYLKDIKKL